MLQCRNVLLPVRSVYVVTLLSVQLASIVLDLGAGNDEMYVAHISMRKQKTDVQISWTCIIGHTNVTEKCVRWDSNTSASVN
jgi:hypothetical protein